MSSGRVVRPRESRATSRQRSSSRASLGGQGAPQHTIRRRQGRAAEEDAQRSRPSARRIEQLEDQSTRRSVCCRSGRTREQPVSSCAVLEGGALREAATGRGVRPPKLSASGCLRDGDQIGTTAASHGHDEPACAGGPVRRKGDRVIGRAAAVAARRHRQLQHRYPVRQSPCGSRLDARSNVRRRP